jgi:hypothetical protein
MPYASSSSYFKATIPFRKDASPVRASALLPIQGGAATEMMLIYIPL